MTLKKKDTHFWRCLDWKLSLSFDMHASLFLRLNYLGTARYPYFLTCIYEMHLSPWLTMQNRERQNNQRWYKYWSNIVPGGGWNTEDTNILIWICWGLSSGQQWWPSSILEMIKNWCFNIFILAGTGFSSSRGLESIRILTDGKPSFYWSLGIRTVML